MLDEEINKFENKLQRDAASEFKSHFYLFTIIVAIDIILIGNDKSVKLIEVPVLNLLPSLVQLYLSINLLDCTVLLNFLDTY